MLKKRSGKGKRRKKEERGRRKEKPEKQTGNLQESVIEKETKLKSVKTESISFSFRLCVLLMKFLSGLF